MSSRRSSASRPAENSTAALMSAAARPELGAELGDGAWSNFSRAGGCVAAVAGSATRARVIGSGISSAPERAPSLRDVVD
jgi:hypothetical protein